MPNVRFIAVSGYGANHLEMVPLANTPINVVASSEDPLYLAVNQINRNAIKPWKPWRALDTTEDQELVFDKNQMFNGGFEAGTLGDTFAAGWEAQGVEVVNSPVHSGTLALQFGASELEPEALQTIVGRAGEKVTVETALQALTAGEGNVQVYIEDMGLWLNADGVTWQNSETVWFNRTTTSMLLKTSSPVMPVYNPLVPGGVYTVTITLDGHDFVADSVAWWHWTDTAAIIGHNVHPVIADTELQCSSDNSSFTAVEEFDPLKWPTSYMQFTLRGERWWKFLYEGANDQPIWNGQCILTQELALSRNPNYGIIVETALYQERNETKAGASWVVPKEDIQRRMFRFPWRYHSSTEWQQARDRIFHTSKFGAHPTVLIHDDTDAESCAFVRPPDKYDYTHKFVNVRDSLDFPLRELAFPTFD